MPEHLTHGDGETADDGGRLVTLAEAAETLSVSVRTVRRLIAHGYLEGYRVGPRAIRVHETDVGRVLTRMPEGYGTDGDGPDGTHGNAAP